MFKIISLRNLGKMLKIKLCFYHIGFDKHSMLFKILPLSASIWEAEERSFKPDIVSLRSPWPHRETLSLKHYHKILPLKQVMIFT
jgi:hypothetical protein